jgi:hypothetical protein
MAALGRDLGATKQAIGTVPVGIGNKAPFSGVNKRSATN